MLSRFIRQLSLALCLLASSFTSAQVASPGSIPVPNPRPLPVPLPRFDTWKTDPTEFKKPDYPIVFVASYRDSSVYNGGNFGTDVTENGVPLGGQELWIVLPNGVAKKLFPIPSVHAGSVDSPINSPEFNHIVGSVVEPSISIDGSSVYFTYVHDASNLPPFCCGTTAHSNFEGWTLGGDLYVIDLQPLINNWSFATSQLEFSRLTQTLPGQEYAQAMNPYVAEQTENNHKAGVMYTGATEIDTAYGRKLLFTGTQRELGNSNTQQNRRTRNFNLFSADIDFIDDEYELSNIKQEQYYTTTSAISPNRLRVGYAFSYQSNTEDNRQWHIQQVIGHEWTPLYGYGIADQAAHLSTFCVKQTASAQMPAGDYELVTRYYNINNNGFGTIFAQPMSNVGQNTYNSPVFDGVVPRQYNSVNVTAGVVSNDVVSPIGKYTTPACGGPDELFIAYDPGIANHRNQQHTYQPEIVFTDLEPANPSTNPAAYQPVVRGRTAKWSALWPKPVIDWSQRLTGVADVNGNAQQQPPPSPIDNDFPEPAGSPFAMLGTSVLYNTDVTPIDCRHTNNFYYDPFETNTGRLDNLFNNIANLSRLMVEDTDGTLTGDILNQTGSCTMPGMSDIFGIALYMTSNRVSEHNFLASQRGYVTDKNSNKESKKLLGVFELGMLGQLDASFKAIVPANTPIEFHLLDKNGTKLADVRSWHSLKPMESRVDCGGCHNHRIEPGSNVPWTSSDSSSPLIASLDTVRQTTFIEYDAMCQPQLATSSEPVKDIPVWQDISDGFDSNCSSCHAQGATPSATDDGRQAFAYDQVKLNTFNNGVPVAGNPLDQLFARKYIDRYGANGSRLFWAAYGSRTDGRYNDRAQYQPEFLDYSTCSNTSPEKCGYRFSDIHSSLPICDGTNPVAAQWVQQLAQWIDHHAPVDVVDLDANMNPIDRDYQYHYDRYHPTVDVALVPGASCLQPNALTVGFWDDSGSLASLDIQLNGSHLGSSPLLNPANGLHTIPLSGGDISGVLDFLVAVKATDAAEAPSTTGNQQSYVKSVAELVQECQAAL